MVLQLASLVTKAPEDRVIINTTGQPDKPINLLKGEPDGTGKTDYTAWFLSPDTTTWKLIASWKRPQTSTYRKVSIVLWKTSILKTDTWEERLNLKPMGKNISRKLAGCICSLSLL